MYVSVLLTDTTTDADMNVCEWDITSYAANNMPMFKLIVA